MMGDWTTTECQVNDSHFSQSFEKHTSDLGRLGLGERRLETSERNDGEGRRKTRRRRHSSSTRSSPK